MKNRVFFILAILALTACTSDKFTAAKQASLPKQKVAVDLDSLRGRYSLDVKADEFPEANLIFVVDNSESMEQVQAKVAAGVDVLTQNLKGKISIMLLSTTSEDWNIFSGSADQDSGLNLFTRFIYHPAAGGPFLGKNPFSDGFIRSLLGPNPGPDGNRPKWQTSMGAAGLAPFEQYIPKFNPLSLNSQGEKRIEISVNESPESIAKKMSDLSTAIKGIGLNGSKLEAPLCAVRQIIANQNSALLKDRPNAIIFVTDEDDAINEKEGVTFNCIEKIETTYNRNPMAVLEFQNKATRTASAPHGFSVPDDKGGLVSYGAWWYLTVNDPLTPVEATPRDCTLPEFEELYQLNLDVVRANAFGPVAIFPDKATFLNQKCTVTDDVRAASLWVSSPVSGTVLNCDSQGFYVRDYRAEPFSGIQELKAFLISRAQDKRPLGACRLGKTYEGAQGPSTLSTFFSVNTSTTIERRNQIVDELADSLSKSTRTKPIVAGLLNMGTRNPAQCGALVENESKYLEKFIRKFGGEIASVCDTDKYKEVLTRLREKITKRYMTEYEISDSILADWSVYALYQSGIERELKLGEDYELTKLNSKPAIRFLTKTNIEEMRSFRFLEPIRPIVEEPIVEEKIDY